MSIQVLDIQNYAWRLRSYTSRHPKGQEDLWRNQPHQLCQVQRKIRLRALRNQGRAHIHTAEAPLKVWISTMALLYSKRTLFNLHAAILSASILVCHFFLHPPKINFCQDKLSAVVSDSSAVDESHDSEGQQRYSLIQSLGHDSGIYLTHLYTYNLNCWSPSRGPPFRRRFRCARGRGTGRRNNGSSQARVTW